MPSLLVPMMLLDRQVRLAANLPAVRNLPISMIIVAVVQTRSLMLRMLARVK